MLAFLRVLRYPPHFKFGNHVAPSQHTSIPFEITPLVPACLAGE